MRPQKIKKLRVLLDAYRDRSEHIMNLFGHKAIEVQACISFIKASRRRLGLALKALNQESPYSEADNPENDTIEDRADTARYTREEGIGPDDVIRLTKMLRQDLYTAFIHPLQMVVDGTGYKNSTYDRQIKIALNGLEEARMALGEFLAAIRDKVYEPVHISIDKDLSTEDLEEFAKEWNKGRPVTTSEPVTVINRIY